MLKKMEIFEKISFFSKICLTLANIWSTMLLRYKEFFVFTEKVFYKTIVL